MSFILLKPNYIMFKITALAATLCFGIMHADVLTDYLRLKRQHDTIEAEQKNLYAKERYVATIRKAQEDAQKSLSEAFFPHNALETFESEVAQAASKYSTADWLNFEDSIKDINCITYPENPQADAQAADAIAAFIALKSRHIDEEKISGRTYTSHLQHIEEQRIRQGCEQKVDVETQFQKLNFAILFVSSLALANAPFTNKSLSDLDQEWYIPAAAISSAAALSLWIVCKTAENVKKINTTCEQDIVSSPLYAQLKQLTEEESL